MSTQVETLNKIKTREEQARNLVSCAEEKARDIISEAKANRVEIMQKAEQRARAEADTLEKDSLRKAGQETGKIAQNTKAELQRLMSLADKNIGKASDYIISEFLKLWQLRK
jgi:vacuolar-type H+-ATPase subunit H